PLSKAFKPVITYPSLKFLKGGAEGNFFQEVPLRKNTYQKARGGKLLSRSFLPAQSYCITYLQSF
ncbi:MAG: hypothetical protein ACI3XQ_01460, partial [Eubacteriales bacterium]